MAPVEWSGAPSLLLRGGRSPDSPFSLPWPRRVTVPCYCWTGVRVQVPHYYRPSWEGEVYFIRATMWLPHRFHRRRWEPWLPTRPLTPLQRGEEECFISWRAVEVQAPHGVPTNTVGWVSPVEMRAQLQTHLSPLWHHLDGVQGGGLRIWATEV